MNDSGSSSDGGSSGDGSSTSKSELPDVDFSTFVLSLAHSALVHLGDAPDPTGGTSKPDLAVAKQTIDLIALLSEKTKGNLTGEEERIVEQLLYDLRSRYVSVKSEK